MHFNKAKFISLLLAALWTVCTLHCVADKALAHGHFHAGDKAPHHHHPFGESHQHDSELPADGDSHDSESILCCEVTARLSSSLIAEKDTDRHTKLPSDSNLSLGLAPQLFLGFLRPPVVEPNRIFLAIDLLCNLRALLAPNAPPI